MDRSSCWSITINNPVDADVVCPVPGWKLTGQFERGETGTRHFQGMLQTPQVRFSAVKKAFPRAHIEIAVNSKALAVYVSKSDTRVGTYEANNIPSLFAYQDMVALGWDGRVWSDRVSNGVLEKVFKDDMDNMALSYIDEIVAQHIESGRRGLEYIAINPMWRSSWKKFWRSIIKRNASAQAQTVLDEKADDDSSRSEGTEARRRLSFISSNGDSGEKVNNGEERDEVSGASGGESCHHE